MLSNEHESLAELFRHQPSLAAELAADLGVDVPRFASATLEPGDYSDVMPTEWRSDGVVALTDDAGDRAMAIVVEVQLGWPTQKRWVAGWQSVRHQQRHARPASRVGGSRPAGHGGLGHPLTRRVSGSTRPSFSAEPGKFSMCG